MKLRDVLNTMASGELSNLSLFNEQGVLKPEHYSKLTTSINLGLTDLHTRFLLKLGSITLNLQAGQTVYPLKPMYQVGNRAPAGTVQFIEAGETKLKDNLLKVQQVFDDCGHELGLNDHDARRGVSTTTFNVLTVPECLQKDYGVGKVSVSYRMNALPIRECFGELDIDAIEVDLDYSHLWALCLFVASRVHNPSGFGTGGVHEGNNYYGKYIAECDRLDAANMRLDYVADNVKGRQKGFP